jgi:peptide/nickel transport system substrate-binding protein
MAPLNELFVSRREVLKRGAAAAGLVAGTPLFAAACGGSSSSATTTAATTGKPKKGGILRVGQSGGGSTDQLDADIILNLTDNARLFQLYEQLAYRDHNFQLQNSLAESMEPNATGDEWTVRLLPDVEFHNGKTLTADDLIFSFQRILNPKTGAGAASLLSFLDPHGMQKIDSRTAKFKCLRPFYLFADRVGQELVGIIPVGYDPKQPVGTGPFKYTSFTPGQQSVFTAFENYRGPGPYVDQLIIVDYDDDTARVNALLSGQVDAIDGVPYSLVETVKGNSSVNLLVSETGAWSDIGMRIDTPPFSDNRVRQAMRLIVNRPQMLEEAYSGHGRIANDLYSPYDPAYYSALPQREQDIDQAKFLLKQAGQSGLSTTLVTADVEEGAIESCLVFAEQAKAAGVHVNVQTLDTTTFYNSQYENRPFSVDWWETNSFFTQVAYGDGPGALYNECHWKNPQYDALYEQAIATSDESKRIELAHEMQHMLYTEGGLIIFAFRDGIDAYSNKVTGFVPDKTGQALSSWDFKSISFV